MRSVLLIGALLIGACTTQHDSSTADTLELKPAPATLDTTPDSLKVKLDTVTLNEDKYGHDLSYTAIGSYDLTLSDVAHVTDPGDLSVPHEVARESSEANVCGSRQHESTGETAPRVGNFHSPYFSVQLLRTDTDRHRNADGTERCRCSGTDIGGSRNDPPSRGQAERSPDRATELQSVSNGSRQRWSRSS